MARIRTEYCNDNSRNLNCFVNQIHSHELNPGRSEARHLDENSKENVRVQLNPLNDHIIATYFQLVYEERSFERESYRMGDLGKGSSVMQLLRFN